MPIEREKARILAAIEERPCDPRDAALDTALAVLDGRMSLDEAYRARLTGQHPRGNTDPSKT